jgi:hypothetical protein
VTYSSEDPGRGTRQLSGWFLVLLLVPTLVGVAVVSFAHVALSRGRRHSPGRVWGAAAWCFGAAATSAFPLGMVVLWLLDAGSGADSAGDELVFLGFGWLVVLTVVPCAFFAVLLLGLGLAVVRGSPWSRWTTAAMAGVLFVGGLIGVLATAGEQGGGFLVALAVTFLAPVAVPFLFGPEADAHFSAPAAGAAPPHPPHPGPDPEPPALIDRWRNFS